MNTTRQFIIDKTIKVISKNGVASTGIKEIAKACNISSSTLYHHFKNKYDLMLESILYIAQKFAICIQNAVLPDSSVEENYRRALKSIVDYVRVNADYASFYLHISNVPSFTLNKEDMEYFEANCPLNGLFEKGIRENIIHRVPNINFIAYFPIYMYTLYNLNASDEQDYFFISRMWDSIAVK